jgi:hypothetical protein
MMEINVKMMTEEAYKTLQTNFQEVYQQIIAHPSDSGWLKDYLGKEPYETKKYVIEDFQLENDNDYQKVALKNAILLYERLHDLPRYIVCSNRFWAWITFEKAYKEAQNSTKITGADIIKSWWLGGNGRRDLMLGVVSRSYFKIEVSLDPSRGNKYELSEYLMTNAESYRNIAYRNIGMLKNVTLGILSAEKKISDETGKSLNRLQCREIMKDASRLGSVKLIDVMTKEEIENALYEKLKAIVQDPQFIDNH